MSIIGLIALLIAFAGCVISVACLAASAFIHGRSSASGNPNASDRADTFSWSGRLATVLASVALTVCCIVIVWCFFSGDISLDYVVRNRSDATGSLGWLFKLSGLWAGRAGSLLFWAWLISLFSTTVVIATRKSARSLDNAAIAVTQLVLLAFVGVLLFSEENMPFALLNSTYFDENGNLTSAASVLGMNTLLEHWAMAIHPPTLFIGYAGLTIPFAYAIAALIVDDDSAAWVVRSTPFLMVSWIFLGIGIGLGAIWAYVVLGWGGYWGWDPVENASLLPWLVGVALIHSFTIYRQRGEFKRWSVMAACLAFCFVVMGTFITRSGLVESVHAFEGDPVSLVLFLILIVASVAAGAVGLFLRRKTFGREKGSEDEMESLVSRDAAYYVNNLIMVLSAILLAYLTISSALPPVLPFGSQALSAGTYNAIARPLGIAYCALVAICPLLGWRKTEGSAFRRRALIPGLCALVLFALLMIYFASYLLPSYNDMIAAGGTEADGLLEQGAPPYYNGLAVVGFAVASLLVFNSLFMVLRAFRKASGHENGKTANIRRHLPAIGGGICHLGMGIILVGLIGSSMYVTEKTAYLPYDEETDSCSETFRIQDFELTYAGNSIDELGNGDILYSVIFDVTKDGRPVGEVSPAIQAIPSTQQQKLEASVIGFPLEDLFVVYRGISQEGAFALDVRVNPLITFVWIGFALLMVGAVTTLFSKRRGAPMSASGKTNGTDALSQESQG